MRQMANYDGIMSFWRDRKKNKTYEIADAQARDDISSLATVASTGDYDDLLNKPTIPAAQVNADWNASSGVAEILNKPTIPTDADDISYDNTNSGLYASDVQNAIDEVAEDKMNNDNPKGTGSFSMNRKANTTIGLRSVAEGNECEASGDYSYASGWGSEASGLVSFACGNFTEASGDYSHVEGSSTVASGDHSHAEGSSTVASGDNSHAEGYHTEAASDNQHVSGRFNVVDTQNAYAEIIGNGTGNSPSNARTLDWSGNETLQGDLTLFEGSVNEMDVSTAILGKQDALTAGTNISISNNTISATDTKPTGYDTADVSSKALASSANWSNISSVNITAGTWLINYGVNFPSQGSGNTGHRGVGISVESGTSAPAINMRLCTPAITQDNYTTLASFGFRVATGNETLYLNARQTSGSSMNVAGRLRVIKIL